VPSLLRFECRGWAVSDPGWPYEYAGLPGASVYDALRKVAESRGTST
jgi:hypothetical protein